VFYPQLFFFLPNFLPKLREFWNLRQSILDTSGKVEEIILWRLAGQDAFQNRLNALKGSLERTQNVQNVTNQIV